MSDASGAKRRDAALETARTETLDNAPGREHFIYAITFLPTGKRYIGQTVDFRIRCYQHKTKLRNNKHWCAELQRDWNENGKSAFSFSILEDAFFTKDGANIGEAHFIQNTFLQNKECYNYLVSVGKDGKLTPIPKLRLKHSENIKKAWTDPSSDLRNPIRTRWDDPDQKRVQSESQKRRYSDPEARRITSEATKAGWARKKLTP